MRQSVALLQAADHRPIIRMSESAAIIKLFFRSTFLPEERAWLDDLFGRVRWVDGFRAVDERPEQYTWWSNRGQAWAKNVGWRIDYQVVSPDFAERIEAARIWKKSRFSDHAPLVLDYDHAF